MKFESYSGHRTADARIKNDGATIRRIAGSLWSRSIFPGNRGEGAHAAAALPSVCNNASRLLTSSDGFEPAHRRTRLVFVSSLTKDISLFSSRAFLSFDLISYCIVER